MGGKPKEKMREHEGKKRMRLEFAATQSCQARAVYPFKGMSECQMDFDTI